jgi:hypothetical protein
LRKRIAVVAIAPASYITPNMCNKVRHYQTERIWRDPVPRNDVFGRLNAQFAITYLKSDPEEPFFDHSLQSKTYREVLTHRENEFIKSGKTRIK